MDLLKGLEVMSLKCIKFRGLDRVDTEKLFPLVESLELGVIVSG